MSRCPEGYYLLSSLTKNPCTMDRERYDVAWEDWLCRGCMRPRQGVKRLDLQIQEKRPDNAALNFVSGTGVGVARKDFLLALGKAEVSRHLYVGRLIDNTGAVFEDWVTFHGKHTIVVRGSKNASSRSCEVCGRATYFAMGSKYLFPAPDGQVSIFDTFDGALVVTQSVIERVTLNRWRKLKCMKLPVLLTPKDSLPVLTV